MPDIDTSITVAEYERRRQAYADSIAQRLPPRMKQVHNMTKLRIIGPDGRKYVSYREAAQVLGMNPATLWNRVKKGLEGKWKRINRSKA